MESVIDEATAVFGEPAKYFSETFGDNAFIELSVGHAMFLCHKAIRTSNGVSNKRLEDFYPINVDTIKNPEDKLAAYLDNMKKYCDFWITDENDLKMAYYYLNFCYGWLHVSLRPGSYAIDKASFHHLQPQVNPYPFR